MLVTELQPTIMATGQQPHKSNPGLSELLNQLRDPGTYSEELQFAGFSFVQLKNVFPPSIRTDGIREAFDESIDQLPLPKETGNAVLEIGSGNGSVGAALYLKNKARISRLLATDINPDAVENTELNFAKHGIPGEVRVSDVYNKLDPEEKFDLIFWNTPQDCFPPADVTEVSMIDRAVLDPGYEAFGRFVEESHQYLNPNGKALFYFVRALPNFEYMTEIAAARDRKLDVLWESETTDDSADNHVLGFFQVVMVP